MIERFSLAAAALVAAAAPASAQLSGSASYQLDALTFDGGGAGLCSGSFAALVGQPAVAPDATLSSVGFGAELGFLTIVDPLASDHPAVFAVDPPHGPVVGGPITLCGMNLDRAGLAAPQSGTVGGLPLTGLTVLSDSTATATVAPNTNGPADLTFTTSSGTALSPGGYMYSPAIRTSPLAYRGGGLRLENFGVPGSIFDIYMSTATTNLPIPGVGTLLIGPAPIFPILYLGSYDPATGIHDVTVTVPTDAVFAGLTLYFQSAVLSFPFAIELVNRSETLVQ